MVGFKVPDYMHGVNIPAITSISCQEIKKQADIF